MFSIIAIGWMATALGAAAGWALRGRVLDSAD